MNLHLEDKVFVVSGSSRGIGKGIARVLLEEGARVTLTGRDKKALLAAFNELSITFSGKVLQYAGDLNDEKTLRGARELILGKWNRIDGIVANAGGVRPVNNELSEADWQWFFAANFDLARRFVNYFIPDIKASKGSVVFISSIAGLEDIVGAPLAYSASKAALNVYAKGLARELASCGVRVNTVAPGNIFFEGGHWEKKKQVNPTGVQEMLEEKVLLKRFGKPEEIGNLAAFLCSEKAAFITGTCLVADGGQISLFI